MAPLSPQRLENTSATRRRDERRGDVRSVPGIASEAPGCARSSAPQHITSYHASTLPSWSQQQQAACEARSTHCHHKA